MIGLDAAEWDLLQPLMDEGTLPNLARLRDRSAVVRLHQTGPLSGPWESFLLGRNTVEDAYVFHPKSYESFYLGPRTIPPFYSKLGSAEIIALDVPSTSLVAETNGAQLIWGVHTAGRPRGSLPTEILDEVDARFGVHPAFENDQAEWYRPESFGDLARRLADGARRRVEIAQWLLKRFPSWELSMVVFSETHSGGEAFWQGIDPEHPLAGHEFAGAAREPLIDIYRALDAAVGELVGSLPDDAVAVVCSLHGSASNKVDLPSMVLLPELLYRYHFKRPFLTDPPVEEIRGVPIALPHSQRRWNPYMRDLISQGPAQKLKRKVTDAKKLLTKGRSPVVERRVDPSGREIRLTGWTVTSWYREHWPRMRAFEVPSFVEGRVRINVTGREGRGVVSHDDYVATRNEMVELLKACTNPRTGRSVLEEVVLHESIDPFDVPDNDPDVSFYWSEAMDSFEHPELGRVGPFPYRTTGGHTDHGFAFFSGPGIAPGELGSRPALDLVPTIVELLGKAVPEGTEGTPIDLGS